MDLRGKNAIVTGASSGIGRATALALTRRGANVTVAARRSELLGALAEECRSSGVRCIPVTTDVARREECLRLASEATRELGPIDILVNNAGFAIFDPVDGADPNELRAMMNTNYFGTVWCTQAVLPQMLERRRGTIVNVSSITGIMGFARMSGYCATKFAITGFTEGLRDEVMERGVRVSLVCPGTTLETEFLRTAQRGKVPGASRLILGIRPERVARAVLRAIDGGRDRIILPWPAWAYMRMKETLPRFAHFWMRHVSALIERNERS